MRRVGESVYYKELLKPQLNEIVGDESYKLEHIVGRRKLVTHTNRVNDTQLESVTALLESMLSHNITIKQYNHNIEISWRNINKYADCTTPEDMLAVNENYKNDVTSDGEWVYPLPNLHIDMQNNSNPPFKGSSIKIFCVDVPSTTNGDYLFCESASLEEVNMDFSHFTSVRRMFQYAKAFKRFPENFNPQTRDFTGLLVGAVGLFNKNAEGKVMIPYHPVLNEVVYGSSMFHLNPVAESYWTAKEKLDERYTFDYLVIGSQMFRNGWDYLGTGIGGDIVLNLISLEDGEWMFGGNFISSFTSPLPKLRIGNHMFSSRDVRLFSVFNSELPSLESGNGMFNNVKLDKVSALRVLNSIPAYTSGSHPLTIGIHVDHQNDEEVLAAITNAETKGWTLTVQWNGTPTTQSATTYGLRKSSIYVRVGEHEIQDGTTERVLDWGHYVTNPEDYQEFSSLEEASEYFGISEDSEELNNSEQ